VTALTPESYERSGKQNGELKIDGMSKDLGSRELIARAEEVFWYPSEVDVSIRPGWFHHPEQNSQVRSLENLVNIYYQSVGRNSVLLLNIPPDRRGRIHEIDSLRIKELKEYIDETFRTNLLSSTATVWKAESNQTKEFPVKKDAVFNTLLIQEDISRGQRVESFTVETLRNGKWERIAEGTTIGYKRLLKFPDTSAEKIKIRITGARGTAIISETGLYYAPKF
jgi:alpha-L-fucosidase